MELLKIHQTMEEPCHGRTMPWKNYVRTMVSWKKTIEEPINHRTIEEWKYHGTMELWNYGTTIESWNIKQWKKHQTIEP